MRRRGLRKMRVWYAIFFPFIGELHPYKQVMEEPPVGYPNSVVISLVVPSNQTNASVERRKMMLPTFFGNIEDVVSLFL